MIRQPVKTIYSQNFTGTATATAVFTLSDFDFNVLVGKLTASAFSGTSPTLDLYIQTSDDGGTTYYDVAHFTQVTAAVTNANALFERFGGLKGSPGAVGQPKSQNIAANTVSGLPLLGNNIQVAWVLGGTVGTTNATLTIYAVDQDYK